MRYYLEKLASLIITLALISLVTFLIFQILPGNSAEIILGVDADEQQIKALEAELSLDKSVPERYFIWLSGLVRGDLGTSLRYHQSVALLIKDAFKVTATMALFTIILTLIIGIPIGILLSLFKEKKAILPLSVLSQLSLSIPSFCMGVFLILLFSVKLKLFPSINYVPLSEGFFASFYSLLLPSLSIALGSGAILSRYVKVSISRSEGADYVRTARSKGLSKGEVLIRHVLRNAAIPVITILGILVADILGGSIIIENIFSLPGIGRLITVSINSRDLPLIQSLVLYLALIVVLCNAFTDFIYSLVDPRVRVK